MKNKGEDILYAPWRLNYILSEKEKKCIFCLNDADDEKHFVVFRTDLSFVILNHYPYNNGHVMVVPNRHVSSLEELSDAELTDLFKLVRLTEKVIKSTFKPEGVNIGINLGKAAGAGIEAHLHVHVLPRWVGDANFMTSIGGTRVIPASFEQTYKQLREEFDNATTQN